MKEAYFCSSGNVKRCIHGASFRLVFFLALRLITLVPIVFSASSGMSAPQRVNTQSNATTNSQVASTAEPPDEVAVECAFRIIELKEALLSDDKGAILEASQKMGIARRNYGIYDPTPMIEALCLWAREMAKEGRVEVGLRTMDYFRDRGLRHPVILSTEIILARQSGFFGYLRSLPLVIELSQIRVAQPFAKYTFVFQHLVWTKFVAVFALWCYAALLAIRYRNVLRYMLEQPLAKVTSNSHFQAIGAAALFVLPIIWGIDPSFCAILWIVLLVPTLTGPELRVAVVCLLFQLVPPCFYLLEGKFTDKQHPVDIVELQLQPQIIPLKDRPLYAFPKHDQLFLRGWQALEAKSWKQAEHIFSGLCSESFEKASSLNNLGVALQAQSKTEEAIAAFTEASRIDSTISEPIHNLAIIELSLLEINKAEALLAIASKLDSRKKEGVVVGISQVDDWKNLHAMPLKNTSLRQDALASSFDTLYPYPSVSPTDRDYGLRLSIMLLLPIVGLIALFAQRYKSSNISKLRQCNKCGEISSGTYIPDEASCQKCYHLFIAKDSTDRKEMARRILGARKFQRFQKRISFLLSVLVPGGDKVFLGMTYHGFFLLIKSSTYLGMFLCLSKEVIYPGDILTDPASISSAICLTLLIIAYIQSWYRLVIKYSLRRKI